MRKAWRFKICALVMTLAMAPGVFELLENTAHLVTEGHLAHAPADGDHHSPDGPEHGCTPTLHFCGCHASLALVGSPDLPAIHLQAASFASRLAPEPLLTGFQPSIDRPPRA